MTSVVKIIDALIQSQSSSTSTQMQMDRSALRSSKRLTVGCINYMGASVDQAMAVLNYRIGHIMVSITMATTMAIMHMVVAHIANTAMDIMTFTVVGMAKTIIGATVIPVAKASVAKPKRSVAIRKSVRSAATQVNVKSVTKERNAPIVRQASAARTKVNVVRKVMLVVTKRESVKRESAVRKVNVPWNVKNALL
jgi:hypothetical protein